MWIKIDADDSSTLPPEKLLVLVAATSKHRGKPEAMVTPFYRGWGIEWFDLTDRRLPEWLTITHWQPMLKDPE